MTDNNLPQTSSALVALPQSSLISQDKIAQAIQGFGEEYRDLILCRYQKGKGIEKAVASKAPTFHDVSDYFGEQATKFWLRFHIAETFAFLGIYDTASKFQVQQTADLILSHEIFGQLTLDEFLCFLQRFKRGDYGKIYNSARPNPQEFLMCLQPFWNELSYQRGKQAEKERQEQISRELHSGDNISWEQYCEEKGINKENPLEHKEEG
jgi:hypothetical protein